MGRLYLGLMLFGSACGSPPARIPALRVGGFILHVDTRAAEDGLRIEFDRIEAVHRSKLNGPDRAIVVGESPVVLTIPSRSVGRASLGEYALPPGFLSRIRLRTRSVTALKLDGGTIALTPAPWTIEAGTIDICERTGVLARVNFETTFDPKDAGVPAILAEPASASWSVGESLDGQSPGLQRGQLTVVFKDGVPLQRIWEINEELNTCVLYYGIGSRVLLPHTLDEKAAAALYAAKPEVQSVLQSFNYGSY